jgi:hypothetical protein
LIAVIEMSQSSWLVAGIVLGIERHPAKKLEANEAGLLRLLQPHGTSPWAKGSRRAEAERSGRRISRIAVAFEAGRDGVWLARWLRARDVDAQACPGAGVLSREFRISALEYTARRNAAQSVQRLCDRWIARPPLPGAADLRENPPDDRAPLKRKTCVVAYVRQVEVLSVAGNSGR